jgi:flagellar motor switch protein FliN
MPTPVTSDAVARALAQTVAAAWSATALGAAGSVAPAPAVASTGWMVAVPVTGVATGTLRVWFERESAMQCAARALDAGPDVAEDAATPVLVDVMRRAAAAVESTPEGAGLTAGEPVVQPASAPDGAPAQAAAWADGTELRFAVHVELVSPLAAAVGGVMDDSRLEAVLDVDLPLVVRFGRVVMPLRAVADLSPGSVVDMGRSPDEPVDLLVGERLIARGEVVIVGGNYGVRITELTNGRRATDQEARS